MPAKLSSLDSTARQIEKAWSARWSAELETVIRAFPELRMELGVPLFGSSAKNFESEWMSRKRGVRQALAESDLMLLSASLARAQGKLENCDDLINQAETVLNAAGLAGSFHLHFERGLMSLMRGSHLAALEDFFSAARWTNKPLYRLITLTNALLCLENLGIDAQQTLQEVQSLRSQAPLNHPVFGANELQLNCHRMRAEFRHGDIAASLKETPCLKSIQGLNQATYYTHWLRLLPFHSEHRPLSPKEAAVLVSSPQAFFQKGYRIRTLLGQTHTDDQSFVRISDRIDRLYLWTWMWLRDPAQLRADRLMASLNEVLEYIDLSRLTQDDQFTLRNALGWLTLADPALESRLRPLTRRLEEISAPGMEFFDFEWACIRCISAKLEGRKTQLQDTLKTLKKHALWGRNANGLVALVKKVVDGRNTEGSRLLSVADRLRSRGRGSLGESQVRLHVDLNSYLVSDLVHERKIVSEPLALAFSLLKKRGTVSSQEFIHVTFGIYQYDPLIHGSKIFNLLSRMRSLAGPGLRLKMKSGTILTEGSWNGIVISEPAALSKLMRDEFLGLHARRPVIEGQRPAKQISIAKLFKNFGQGQAFNREEAGRVLNTTKSTITRSLNRLVTEGRLSRQGVGRSTTYCFPVPHSQVSL